MSVGHVLDAAKTITTIRIKLPENGIYYTKTMFLTERHHAIERYFAPKPTEFDLDDALTKSGDARSLNGA